MQSKNVVNLDQETSATERKFLDLVDQSIDRGDRVAPLNPEMFERARELRRLARANQDSEAIEL